MFALYEGIDKLIHPHQLEDPVVAFVVIGVAMALEAYSFRTAIHEASKVRRRHSWWGFIRTAKSPELPVVLLEDFGALIGLVFALIGVSLTVLTDEPMFDALGSIAIGLLLGVIAVVLAIEMKSLLIGEAASPEDEQAIADTIESDPHVEHLIHLRTQHLGPEELLVAAKVELDVTTLDRLGGTIDDLERRIRAAVPHAARHLHRARRVPPGRGRPRPCLTSEPHEHDPQSSRRSSLRYRRPLSTYPAASGAIIPGVTASRRSLAGTPIAIAPLGTSMPLGTNALPATRAPDRTIARWSTTEFDPTSAPSSIDAALEVDEVPDHTVVADDRGELRGAMHDRAVLDRCALTDLDVAVVTAEHGLRPDRGVSADRDVADDRRVRVHEGVGMDRRRDVAERIDGHERDGSLRTMLDVDRHADEIDARRLHRRRGCDRVRA